MGNKIYTICGLEQENQESEINSICAKVESPNVYTRGSKHEERQVKASHVLNLPYKLLLELNEDEVAQLRKFDEYILNHGRWISPKEMAEHIDENVSRIEQTLVPFQIPDEIKEKYQGAFESGPFLFNDGAVYCGQWSLEGKMQGYGVHIKPDGSKYEGMWNNDKIEGLGRYIAKNGNYYEGNWMNGMINGEGTLIATQGSKYVGNWVNDLQEGYGVETFQDGTTYKGQYKNSHKDGIGEYVWSDGSVYIGEFSKSTINGKGTLKWKDQREYTGDWLDNKMHGFGTFKWPDGKKYVGEYKNDKKEGEGTYYWSEDKYYKGQWLNSKQHGDGVIVLRDKTLRGNFRFGKLVKKYDDNKENEKESPNKAMPSASPEKVSNLNVDDKNHHIENIHVGSTTSLQPN